MIEAHPIRRLGTPDDVAAAWFSIGLGEEGYSGGVITGEMAVIWCHRDTHRHWDGKDQPPRDIHYKGDKFITRSTMVFHKENGDWRVVHAHFSEADSGPRPGGI